MQPLRKLIPFRIYLLSFIEAGLAALCYTAATYLYFPIDLASIHIEYEGGATRIFGVALTYLIASYLFDFSKEVHVHSRLVLAIQLCQLIGIIFLVQAVLGFISPDLVPLQPLVLLGNVLTLIVIVIWRLFFRPVLWNAFGAQKILFVGYNRAVEALASAFHEQPSLGMEVVGYVTDPGRQATERSIPGSFSGFTPALDAVAPDRIIVASEIHDKAILKTLFDLKASGMTVETASQTYEIVFGRIYSAGLEPYSIIYRDELSARPASLALQSIYTNVLGLTVVILTLPVMFTIAVLLGVTRKGPVFSKTRCTGLHGIPFNLYRFRCSRSESDWISRFLVACRLESLPQAVNIIRGEMALIGPRAERVEFSQILTSLIPFYRQKQHVKPGIMGWSQLHCDLEPTENTLARLEYDLYYIKHISLVVDAYILVRALKWLLSDRSSTGTRAIDLEVASGSVR